MLLPVSNRGRVTLPAAVRRQLGIVFHSQVELVLREGEIIIRPLKRASVLAGVLSRCARKGSTEDWDTIRQQTETAIGQEVVAAVSARRNRTHRGKVS